MTKANKDGWIRHRGGKCPVEAGVLVDVKLRFGDIISGLPSDSTSWRHEDHHHEHQIMKYRLHKPAEQPKHEEELTFGKVVGPLAITEGGASISMVIDHPYGQGFMRTPLQWRDRIHEIDRTIEALEEERVSLIQRLEAEGLQLLQAKACGSVQPVDDMSDWRNWKVGDKIECLGHCPGQFTQGALYKVRALHKHSVSVDLDDNGSDTNGWGYSNFKWHSRPQS
jgi:hypothetical protein